MSKLVWLFLMFKFIMELIASVVADQPSRSFKITVERNCKNGQDSILAPSSAAALLKNLMCNITCDGGRSADSLQCSCQKDETFIAQTRTCVNNGILVKKNNCKQATFHKVNCDEPHRNNSSYITKNIPMMDNLNRYISIRRKSCRPSTTVISKYLNCRGMWENVSFPIAYQVRIEKNFYEWFRTVNVDGKGPIYDYQLQLRRGLRGRLIKLALECKDPGEDTIHQECVLLKAKGSRTCHFQVTPRLPTTVVTVTPLKQSTGHHFHDLDVKESTPAMTSSEVYTTLINLPTMRSRSEKENGNSNCYIVIAIVIGVVVGVCSLVIAVICFVFRKLLRNKKEGRSIELEEHYQGLRRSTEWEEQNQGLNRSTELEEQYQGLNRSTELEEQYQSLRNLTSIMEKSKTPQYSTCYKNLTRYSANPTNAINGTKQNMSKISIE